METESDNTIIKSNAKDTLSDSAEQPVYDEIVPLIYFISEKLTETHK